MKFDPFDKRFSSIRNPVYAKEGMVATSQPLAAQVGVEILKSGGNAVDAAVATAAALTVVEPTANGIGGDAFALVWMKNQLHGLNASGPAPGDISIDKVKARGYTQMPKHGFIPVTVPGAPKAWASLIQKFGKKSLKEVLAPAIKLAESGFPVSTSLAQAWQRALNSYRHLEDEAFEAWFKIFTFQGKGPSVGQIIRLEDHAQTLKDIASTNGDAFYKGHIADRIDAASRRFQGFIRKEDLSKFDVEWVQPIKTHYKGYDICEMPPNGQGLIALMGLNTVKHLRTDDFGSLDTLHHQFESMKKAFADGMHYISDPEAMNHSWEVLLSDHYGKERAEDIGDQATVPAFGEPYGGGTVYLATADAHGNMVSYIQSNYMGFGSGIVVPDTGIALQNRGHTFSLNKDHVNALGPGKRTYHTIIPGFIMKDGKGIGPFGVMGGYMQPQGHMQVIMNMIDFQMHPQDALDAPRWMWVKDLEFLMEMGFNDRVIQQLKDKGHEIKLTLEKSPFGRGQIILRMDNGVYVGGTESRTDGYIAIL